MFDVLVFQRNWLWYWLPTGYWWGRYCW